MPNDTILVVAAVILMFSIFAGAMLGADLYSRKD